MEKAKNALFRTQEADVVRSIREWASYHPEVLLLRLQTQGIPTADGRMRPNDMRGAADFVLQYSCCDIPVCVWMEAKSSRGKLSDAQKTFQEQVLRRGGYYFVVRSVQDAEDALAEVERQMRSVVPTGMRRYG